MAFQHMGEPYFKAGWGSNVVGLILDDDIDWDEVAEPAHRLLLHPGAARARRPGASPGGLTSLQPSRTSRSGRTHDRGAASRRLPDLDGSLVRRRARSAEVDLVADVEGA